MEQAISIKKVMYVLIILECSSTFQNKFSYTQPTYDFPLLEDIWIVNVCFVAFIQKDFHTFRELFSYLDNFWCFFRLRTATLFIPQFFNPLFLAYTNSNIFLDAMLWVVNLCKSLFIWFAIFISITQVISLYRLSSLSIKLKIINKIIIIVIIKILIKAISNVY